MADPKHLPIQELISRGFAKAREKLHGQYRRTVFLYGPIVLVVVLVIAAYLASEHPEGTLPERVLDGLTSAEFWKEHLVHVSSAIIIGLVVILLIKGFEKDEEFREAAFLKQPYLNVHSRISTPGEIGYDQPCVAFASEVREDARDMKFI